MHRVQYDSHGKHDAYGQHGPEEDCVDADHYVRDYVYVYRAYGSGGRGAGALDGVGAGGRGTWRQQTAAGDTDLAGREREGRAWTTDGLGEMMKDA